MASVRLRMLCLRWVPIKHPGDIKQGIGYLVLKLRSELVARSQQCRENKNMVIDKIIQEECVD